MTTEIPFESTCYDCGRQTAEDGTDLYFYMKEGSTIWQICPLCMEKDEANRERDDLL